MHKSYICRENFKFDYKKSVILTSVFFLFAWAEKNMHMDSRVGIDCGSGGGGGVGESEGGGNWDSRIWTIKKEKNIQFRYFYNMMNKWNIWRDCKLNFIDLNGGNCVVFDDVSNTKKNKVPLKGFSKMSQHPLPVF